MDEFKVFPSSLNLSSAIYYVCGVDICEEGLQFCNVFDRRCEYCVDHHYDCFTYIQQQNCTQYCQDQWLMNQLEKQSLIRGIDIPKCPEYKIASIALGILLFFTIISMLFCVARIRQWFTNMIINLLPESINRKRKNDTNVRNRQQRSSIGSGIEDLDAMERMDIGNDILEQSPQNELTTGRKSNTAQIYKHSESLENIYENILSHENNTNMTVYVANRTNYYKQGIFSEEEEKTNGFVGREVDKKYETEERESKQDVQRFNNPVTRSEVLMEHNKAIPPKSNDRPKENGINTCSPRGELSTLSSHGNYRAMVPSDEYVSLYKSSKHVTT